MAVYTTFNRRDAEEVAARWALGRVLTLRGIPQGSINTNYAVETEKGRFFLRHTTVRSEADLDFEAALLDLLHAQEVPAPSLVRTPDGRAHGELLGGRVSVFAWLEGTERTREDTGPVHALRLGDAVGRLHRAAGPDFPRSRQNPYGPVVVRRWLEALGGEQDPEVREALPALRAALEASQGYAAGAPAGVIHADLFMDNVKWVGDEVSALFDFEMACTEALALDVAVTLNAWCFHRGAYDPRLCRAFVEGYGQARPFAEGEPAALYRAARFGAVRYTASRIRDFHLSDLPPDRLFQKDFRTYLARVHALEALGEAGFLRLLGLRGD